KFRLIRHHRDNVRVPRNRIAQLKRGAWTYVAVWIDYENYVALVDAVEVREGRTLPRELTAFGRTAGDELLNPVQWRDHDLQTRITEQSPGQEDLVPELAATADNYPVHEELPLSLELVTYRRLTPIRDPQIVSPVVSRTPYAISGA